MCVCVARPTVYVCNTEAIHSMVCEEYKRSQEAAILSQLTSEVLRETENLPCDIENAHYSVTSSNISTV